MVQPPANSVYMTDAPPPYPGINGSAGYTSGGAWQQPAPPQQTGYYDPNNPSVAYVPPPAYSEFDNTGGKKND